MKISDSSRYALGIYAGIAMLAACNSAGSQLTPLSPMQNSAQSALNAGPAAFPAGVGPNLYVANYGSSTVTVYASGSSKILRTISHGMKRPVTVAFDQARNLYVANSGNSVTVYAAGSTKLLRTISQGVSLPAALAFDRAGNLYVANAGATPDGTVTVYAPGTKTVLQTISQGIARPSALGFDSSQNLYVANCTPPFFYSVCEGGNVTVYAPGSGTVLRTIDTTSRLSAIALDGSGDLYVAHNSLVDYHTVTAYAAGSKKVLRRLTRGVDDPVALAFDTTGNLYVANCETNRVTVYALRSKNVMRAIVQGISCPDALLFGRYGNLYVANEESNSVTVYGPGGKSVRRTISQGVNAPTALAFGP